MKLLFISNIAGETAVSSFSKADVMSAKMLGINFHLAENFNLTPENARKLDEEIYGIRIHHIDFIRTPYNPRNIRAYKQLIELINKEKIDAIHCNTPIGGLLGRIAGKKCKVKKVIYQAHGFHFYKGAPKLNWLLYYPVEKWLARYTDALITINQEDYELAKNKFKLRNNGKVYYVPGVGIDTSQYNLESKHRNEKRTELGLSETDIALISMGDLIERKNYSTAIQAIAEAKNPNLQYFICGNGSEEANLKALADKLGVSSQIHFLGFRSDIKELLAASDIFLFTTKQEGLPRSMLEAMASGLPCIASRIRGNTDLLEDTDGGFLCEATDAANYADKLNLLADDSVKRSMMGANNLSAIRKFSIEAVPEETLQIYKNEFGGVTLDEFIQSLSEYYPAWAKKRIELGIPLNAFVLVSVGELNKNKNNRVVIAALEKLHQQDIHYVLCGVGDQEAALKAQANAAGLQDNVHFLGYRTDVKEIYEMADCFVMPSLREGLSRSIMEAMASGLPCVVSSIRGNTDLITDHKGGFLCAPTDRDGFASAIITLYGDDRLRNEMISFNMTRINRFALSSVIEELNSVYKEI